MIKLGRVICTALAALQLTGCTLPMVASSAGASATAAVGSQVAEEISLYRVLSGVRDARSALLTVWSSAASRMAHTAKVIPGVVSEGRDIGDIGTERVSLQGLTLYHAARFTLRDSLAPIGLIIPRDDRELSDARNAKRQFQLTEGPFGRPGAFPWAGLPRQIPLVVNQVTTIDDAGTLAQIAELIVGKPSEWKPIPNNTQRFFAVIADRTMVMCR